MFPITAPEKERWDVFRVCLCQERSTGRRVRDERMKGEIWVVDEGIECDDGPV